MITVGMLGCAHVHAKAYAGLLVSGQLGARLVAVYDPEHERAVRFADGFGISVFDDPEVLCKGVDAVVVTSEHVRYPELVRAAATVGRPILCEKPLGASAEAAASLMAQSGWLSVAFPVRYVHQVRAAKIQIERAELGPLLATSAVNHGSFPGHFFGNRSLSGGGAIIDHVVHVADALRYLTGCEYRSVYAEAGRFRSVGDVEDCAQVVATTDGGAWVSIDPSWSRPQGMLGANDLAMTLWFEGGRVAIDAFARRGTVVREGGESEHRGYGSSMDALMLADWVSAIVEGRPPPVPALDGWKATEVALAAAASASSGLVVDLPFRD